LELDHVIIAVLDLDAAARELEARHGLASVAGGRHAGWGTANRIVPLGETYIELITVVDETEAGGSVFGRWVAGALRSSPGRPLGWVARTDRLDEVAGRLGLSVSAGSRPGRGGGLLRWRLAGVEQAAAEPALPFFVEWGEGTPLPGRAVVAHPAGAVRLGWVELGGNAERVAGWLGTESLPIAVRAGAPGVVGIVLASDAGEIAMRDPLLDERQR
jgi:Glyoxalase-like domain